MAEILNFDSGVRTYAVNGLCEISYNPTDSNFIERLFYAFDAMDNRQEKYKDEIAKMGDRRKIFEITRKMDAEMREAIDSAFDGQISDKVFGNMNVYAYGNGIPVWANFILAVMDTIDTSFAKEQKLTNPRIAKYTAKYQNR